jgi:hypothetical protein
MKRKESRSKKCYHNDGTSFLQTIYQHVWQKKRKDKLYLRKVVRNILNVLISSFLGLDEVKEFSHVLQNIRWRCRVCEHRIQFHDEGTL